MKYTLYHIKGLKWGCTRRTLKQRFSDRDYRNVGLTVDDVCETEVYDDMKIASDREYELNTLNNYKGQLCKYSDFIDKYEKLHTFSPMNKPHTKTKEHRKNISKARLANPTINNPKGNPEKLLLYASKPGESNGNSKLIESQVKDIRKKYASKKYSQYKLAKIYNVSKQQIRRIVNRESWKHI